MMKSAKSAAGVEREREMVGAADFPRRQLSVDRLVRRSQHVHFAREAEAFPARIDPLV